MPQKVNYDRSKPENEPDAQEEKEENPDAENAKMEMPFDGTFCQGMTPCNVMPRIKCIH